MLFVYLCNPNYYNSCYFEWNYLTKPYFINLFNLLKEATKTFLGVPPRSLFFLWLQNQNQRSLLSWNVRGAHCWVSNSWNITTTHTKDGSYLGDGLITVLYYNPKQGDCRIMQIINPIQISERSLQLKWGLLRVLFNLCNNMMIHLAAIGLLRQLDRRRRLVAARLRTSCWKCLTNSLVYS